MDVMAVPSLATDVPGWFSRRDAAFLLQYATPGLRVLEVGTWCGRSAITMARHGCDVVCVDTFRGDSGTGLRDVYEEFLENIQRHGVDDRIYAIRGDFRQVLPQLDLSLFDVAFLDADHTYAATAELLAMVLAGVRADAVVVLHDANYSDVASAICEQLVQTGRELMMDNCIAAMLPKKS